jgi:hypothetical protein
MLLGQKVVHVLILDASKATGTLSVSLSFKVHDLCSARISSFSEFVATLFVWRHMKSIDFVCIHVRLTELRETFKSNVICICNKF